MRPFLSQHYGNPSSHHWAGEPTKRAIEKARRQVAALLDCLSQVIILASGGTEANNQASKGAFFSLRQKGNHIITTQVEHPAVLQPAHCWVRK
jgi:cysteine desulfurase